jgi:glycosyltransferase involved in cell wall biosynthesis
MNNGVRVVIPNHNYARFVPVCVESVLSQAGVDLEVLIIDDASSDDSQRIAASLAARDRRVRVRCHAVNQGHIRTYNEGLEWAAGATYAVVLDADDALTPGSLRRAWELLEAHPETGFVYGRPRVFPGNGPPPAVRTGLARWRTWPGREWFEIRCRRAENCVFSPEVVLRTSVVRNAGGFREDLPHTADFELWMRLALHADVGYIRGPYQAYYRDHAAGLHRRVFNTTIAEMAQVKKAFEAVFQACPDKIVNRQRLEKVLGRALARRALGEACRAFDRGRLHLPEAVQLEELALDAYRDVNELAEWRVLQWRKVIGSRLSRMALPLRLVSFGQHLGRRLNRYRLRASGL